MNAMTNEDLTSRWAKQLAEQERLMNQLLKAIKENLPGLKDLFAGDSGYEDPVYRFYYQSFKVYRLQDSTKEIVAALQKLLPERELDKGFMQIVQEGTGKVFKPEDNENWLPVTRPFVEAFFHARYFLEMAVEYGEQLESPPQVNGC